MTLTWNETIDLLKVVTAKDRRTVGQADIQFWFAAAQEAGWPNVQFAIAAVVRHSNDAPGVWFEPGHITAYWRKVKADTAARWNPPAPPAELIDDDWGSYSYVQDEFRKTLDEAIGWFVDKQRGFHGDHPELER